MDADNSAMLSSQPKSEFEVKQWELSLGGLTVSDRTQNLGHDSLNYRKAIKIPKVDGYLQQMHNLYMHELGKESLKAQLDDDKLIELEKVALLKKTTKIAKILKRKIKVTDLEDGGVSITIDQEWDTSTWSEELIQAGCDALILIFYDTSDGVTSERKERALQMLQKLLFRHTYAETYLRKNVDLLIGKAATRIIRRGKCTALLDILFILDSCKDKYISEISACNFNGRVVAMLIQEARLAAIMIQHAYRAKRNRNLSYKMIGKCDVNNSSSSGFGTDREVFYSRLSLINARTYELRENWRLMHRDYSKEHCKLVSGIRGPIYVGSHYIKVALELIAHLVSEKAGKYAHGNREDVMRSMGCILFTAFLASYTGQYSRITAKLLANIAKVWEGYLEIIGTGCIDSAVKAMKYLRTVLNVAVASNKATIDPHDKVSPVDAYIACLEVITYTAIHAAGMHRAYLRYRFIIPPHDEVERVDYSLVLNILVKQSNYSRERLTQQVKGIFGQIKLLKELSSIIIETEKTEILVKALSCLYAILCTEAHAAAMSEVKAMQGLLMIRLVNLLQNKELQIGYLCVCIFLQICTEDASRQTLGHFKIAKHLTPYCIKYGFNFKHIPLQRSIAVIAALCRQCSWRYYDPQTFISVVNCSYQEEDGDEKEREKREKDHGARRYGGDATATHSATIRLLVFYDILRTMRTTAVVTDAIAEQFSIADWVVMVNNEPACVGMSRAAGIFGVKALVDFICHPNDENYYDSLPIQESSAACIVLEGLAADSKSAKLSFSSGVINFLSKFIFLCKYLFLGKTMLKSQIFIVLNGVKSAALAMGRYAVAVKDDLKVADEYVKVAIKTELLASVLFFMNTLSIVHPHLDEETTDLQKSVGMGCLDFLSMYASMVTCIDGKSTISSSRLLFPAGAAVVNLINYLKIVHGRSPQVVDMFNRCCNFLCQATLTNEGCSVAIQEWKIFNALHLFLPTPLSGLLPEEEAKAEGLQISIVEKRSYDMVGDDDTEARAVEQELKGLEERYQQITSGIRDYKIGLEQLLPSFFFLCSNLCAIDQGKAICFTDGYLRRSLDNLNLMDRTFMKNKHHYQRNHTSDEWSKLSEKLISCFKVIANAANFHQSKQGSSNDLIINPFYKLIDLCKHIITWQLYVPKANRSSQLITSVYEALSMIAKDNFRINGLFEQFDVLSMIGFELSIVDSLSVEAAKAAVLTIDRTVTGYTSSYITRVIPLLREPLTRVSRIYPQLGMEVRNSQWALTKSAALYKQTIDPQFHPDRFVDKELEEFLRSGTIHHKATAAAAVVVGSSSSSSLPSLKEQGDIAVNTTSSNNVEEGVGNVVNHDATAPSMETVRAGTYMYCGVSSCGSLRIPGQECKHHGLYLTMTDEERERQLMHLTFKDSNVCAISQLSARSPQLQERLNTVKGSQRFRDLTHSEYPTHSRIKTPKSKRATTAPLSVKNYNNSTTSSSLKRSPTNHKNNSQFSDAMIIPVITIDELPQLMMTRPKK